LISHHLVQFGASTSVQSAASALRWSRMEHWDTTILECNSKRNLPIPRRGHRFRPSATGRSPAARPRGRDPQRSCAAAYSRRPHDFS